MNKKPEPVGQSGKIDIYRLETEPFGTNAYMLICRESGESILIDAPGSADLIAEKLAGSAVQYILITHGHMDHITALEELQAKLGAPVAVHAGDAAMLPLKADRLLEEGERIFCGKTALEVIHTPGHTAGSISFRAGNYLLCGDTIFPGGPGKTASPEHFRQILASIREKVLILPPETVILPGHGQSSDLKTEGRLIRAFIEGGFSEALCGDVTWT